MAEARGMGRGLAAILTSTNNGLRSPDMGELRELPIESIAPNPHQPRRTFDEQALMGLANSLRARGVLQPILVRPTTPGRYELIAGERRWRAAQLAERTTVPAIVRPHDDAESLELALIENMAREDLNPIDQARACQALVDELGMTREEVGRRVGRSRVAVSNLMRLLDLPDEALDLIARGDLSESHGRAILLASEHDDRRLLAQFAAGESWSVRKLEDEARRYNEEPVPGSGPKRRDPVDADRHDACIRLAEAFRDRFAHDVRVRPKGDGFVISLTAASYDEAVTVAETIGATVMPDITAGL